MAIMLKIDIARKSKIPEAIEINIFSPSKLGHILFNKAI